MTGKITLKDIAKAAGVSEMTVSRALRGSSDISESTRLKVQNLANSMGYVPNRIAGALSSQTVNLVGIVVPSLSSMVFPEVLRGISTTLKESPLQPVIGVSGYDLVEEESVIREMLSWRPSGLIVAGLEHTENALQMMRNADVPVVEIMDTDGTPVDFCVGISHIDAGYQMGKTILQAGHRKIGFVGTKMSYDFRAQKRLAGFEKALSESGITLHDKENYTGGSTLAKGKEITKQLLSRSPDLDCIYFSSDIMSAGALLYCMGAGIEVPGALALAGHNNLEMLEGLPLPLATTEAFRFEIGLQAGKIISNFAEYEGAEKSFKFETKVLDGNSLHK